MNHKNACTKKCVSCHKFYLVKKSLSELNFNKISNRNVLRLLCLVFNEGEGVVISIAKISKYIWGDSLITNNNVTQVVFQLNALLKNRDYILVNIRKIGYVLIKCNKTLPNTISTSIENSSV